VRLYISLPRPFATSNGGVAGTADGQLRRAFRFYSLLPDDFDAARAALSRGADHFGGGHGQRGAKPAVRIAHMAGNLPVRRRHVPAGGTLAAAAIALAVWSGWLALELAVALAFGMATPHMPTERLER